MTTGKHNRGETLAGTTSGRGERRRSLWKKPVLTTALVLLIPLLGNYFIEGWNWRPRAFVATGALVFATAVGYQLITRNVAAIPYRTAVAIVLVTAFMLLWGNFVQAADDVNTAATMYFWVLVVVIIGFAISRLQPRGMARASFVTAGAQVLALVIVLIQNLPASSWTAAIWRGFGFNACFAVLFVLSALLFRRTANSPLFSHLPASSR